jgi:hypothetical protein
MNKKAYILSYDREEGKDYVEFHNKLTSLPEITNWFHYIKSSYILITEVQAASVLSTKIKEIIPSDNYFLIELNLANSNGWLVPKAWEWINKHT